MRLLSNNPRKLVGIEGYGLSVSEWLPLEIPASDSTRRYLKTKKKETSSGTSCSSVLEAASSTSSDVDQLHDAAVDSSIDEFAATRRQQIRMTVKGQLHACRDSLMAGMRARRAAHAESERRAAVRACLDLVEHLVRQSLDVTTAEVETTLAVLEQAFAELDGDASAPTCSRLGRPQERDRQAESARARDERQVTPLSGLTGSKPVRYDKRLR